MRGAVCITQKVLNLDICLTFNFDIRVHLNERRKELRHVQVPFLKTSTEETFVEEEFDVSF